MIFLLSLPRFFDLAHQAFSSSKFLDFGRSMEPFETRFVADRLFLQPDILQEQKDEENFEHVR